jgi:hypothetical protein
MIWQEKNKFWNLKHLAFFFLDRLFLAFFFARLQETGCANPRYDPVRSRDRGDKKQQLSITIEYGF